MKKTISTILLIFSVFFCSSQSNEEALNKLIGYWSITKVTSDNQKTTRTYKRAKNLKEANVSFNAYGEYKTYRKRNTSKCGTHFNPKKHFRVKEENILLITNSFNNYVERWEIITVNSEYLIISIYN